MSLEISHLSRRFGDFTALDDVSLSLARGEFVALLGPSGSGKTTLLRLLAGLDFPDLGLLLQDGRDLARVPARERGVGLVFQHYALFRHMTVARNIAFGLDVQGKPKAEQTRRVHELLELMGLSGLGERYPGQLSGGQRQRVALARALAPEPQVLLLDEPFGAVDARVREELRHWLRRLHDEVHVTSIFVTHDQEEAFSVADKVIVINRGRVEQAASPAEILDHPATEFVARFIGDANVYEGVAQGGHVPVGRLQVPADGLPDGTPVSAVLRFYDLKFWREETGIARVTRTMTLGDRVKVEARIDDGPVIYSQFPRRSSLLAGIEPGARIHIEVTLARLYPRAGSGGIIVAPGQALS